MYRAEATKNQNIRGFCVVLGVLGHAVSSCVLAAPVGRPACRGNAAGNPAAMRGFAGYTPAMRTSPRNPFYVVLCVVGFVFTITAASSCLTVLRGVRPETARAAMTPLESVMHRHGTTLLTAELVVLAVATVGAVGLDEYRGRANARNKQS